MTKHLSLLLLLTCLCCHAAAVEEFGYRVLDKKPQPRDHYVQGLQIIDGSLYVGTGIRGESRLMRYNFTDGNLEKERKLHPKLFGEGVTVFGDRVYQLTWHARMLLVFDRENLEYSHNFRIRGEGWGITNNGTELVYSDGSDQLHFLSPDTGERSRSLSVTLRGRPLHRLNELEWIDGKIWANVILTDVIVIIDPANGQVTATIDLSGLLPVVERQADTNVLNGIARDPADGAIWVTGKRWPWLYRIELVPTGEQ